MKETPSTTRINLWSGPRNISTALMYSFAQRTDTKVVDEPLYAHYLKVTGLNHPGREEVLLSQEQDGKKVIEDVLLGECDKPVLFCKQMTHHLIDVPLDFLSQTKSIILIRDPTQVLISYAKVIEQPTLADIGIKQSFDLFHFLKEKNYHVLVLDSNDVLKNPKKMLSAVCEQLGIGFQPAMLHWEAGPRPEDGVWAKYWYENVHRSTGFAPFESQEKILPERFHEIYRQAKGFYESLSRQAIRI